MEVVRCQVTTKGGPQWNLALVLTMGLLWAGFAGTCLLCCLHLLRLVFARARARWPVPSNAELAVQGLRQAEWPGEIDRAEAAVLRLDGARMARTRRRVRAAGWAAVSAGGCAALFLGWCLTVSRDIVPGIVRFIGAPEGPGPIGVDVLLYVFGPLVLGAMGCWAIVVGVGLLVRRAWARTHVQFVIWCTFAFGVGVAALRLAQWVALGLEGERHGMERDAVRLLLLAAVGLVIFFPAVSRAAGFFRSHAVSAVFAARKRTQGTE
jgi:hypothetical protein